MARQTSRGTCKFCQTEYSKAAMTRHLATCKQRISLEAQAEESKHNQKTRVFHLFVQGSYFSSYWLHLNVVATITLATLDQFFRDIWLECCGHLSDFEIDGTRYVVEAGIEPWEHGQKNMNIPLNKVFHLGQIYSYSYDFGSTTNLTIKVIAEQKVLSPGKAIQVLARNTPPITCDLCGSPASFNCMQCLEDEIDGGWLCENCAENHDCGPELLQPIPNSPRAGICGYIGPSLAFVE